VRKWLKATLIVVGVLLVVAFVALALITRSQAHSLVTQPMEVRNPVEKTPADYGLPYEEVTVTTEDGLKLVGWYIPSQNGAVVLCQHGLYGNRASLLSNAEFLHRHGYGVLLSTVRAHDQSDGELITFGKEEMKDLEAWYQYLLAREDVDPDKIGIIGESMGGILTTQYAAQNKNIKALVLHSTPSSLDDSVKTGITRFTGLPPFPFAPMILFWAERETGVDTATVNTKAWIKEISPRPVFILQGGKDDHIPAQSGQWLYDAAGEPKELWYEPEAAHHGFDEAPFLPEYERRVVALFDRYLLGK
jgi:pimeloyl-ACP methyl ester carboxylesterase